MDISELWRSRHAIPNSVTPTHQDLQSTPHSFKIWRRNNNNNNNNNTPPVPTVYKKDGRQEDMSLLKFLAIVSTLTNTQYTRSLNIITYTPVISEKN